MEWETEVWDALKYAVTGMPVFVRKRALKKIIQATEEIAKKNGSIRVSAEDLVQAARESVPKYVQSSCFAALREYGLNVD